MRICPGESLGNSWLDPPQYSAWRVTVAISYEMKNDAGGKGSAALLPNSQREIILYGWKERFLPFQMIHSKMVHYSRSTCNLKVKVNHQRLGTIDVADVRDAKNWSVLPKIWRD